MKIIIFIALFLSYDKMEGWLENAK